jgi:undecaprenyldiphospho-muramoylpentapeptide beta-N-acetylglucosaminyltransferase
VLWVGGLGGMEVELVKRVGIPFEGIPAAGLHGVGMLKMFRNFAAMVSGLVSSTRILRRFQPDVMLFTGGYLAVPVALGAWFSYSKHRRPRSLLFVPDIEPGLAIKFVSRFITQIAVVDQQSRDYFSPRLAVTVTGYPTRRDLRQWDRQSAQQALGLSSDLPTLLVFGGSRGARSINRALLNVLAELLDELQVIHVSGHLDWQEVQKVRESLEPMKAMRYHAFPYLHELMGAALAAADLVLSRAGAATLGEYPLFGVPAILVPYPYAWRYQYRNAHFLEERGAAVILKDRDLAENLLPLVRDLIRDQSRRERMGQAMRSLACPEAANQIANLLIALAGEKPAKEVELW